MPPPDAPAGAYTPEPTPSASRRAEQIAVIEALPGRLAGLVSGLSPAQLGRVFEGVAPKDLRPV